MTNPPPSNDRVASDDSALEAAAFPLREAAPDSEALVVGQGVFEAFTTYLAAKADLLGLARGAALLGEERFWIRLSTQRTVLPLIGLNLGGLEFIFDRVGNQTQMGPWGYPCDRQAGRGVRGGPPHKASRVLLEIVPPPPLF